MGGGTGAEGVGALEEDEGVDGGEESECDYDDYGGGSDADTGVRWHIV